MKMIEAFVPQPTTSTGLLNSMAIELKLLPTWLECWILRFGWVNKKAVLRFFEPSRQLSWLLLSVVVPFARWQYNSNAATTSSLSVEVGDLRWETSLSLALLFYCIDSLSAYCSSACFLNSSVKYTLFSRHTVYAWYIKFHSSINRFKSL